MWKGRANPYFWKRDVTNDEVLYTGDSSLKSLTIGMYL